MFKKFSYFLAVALMFAVPVVAHAPAARALDPEHRRIMFPVVGGADYSDDFGAPRSGGRKHQGNDLFANKLQPLLAVTDGTVKVAKMNSGISGNILILEDDDGWQYYYIHINNDSPGTDDGLSPPELVFPPGIEVGVKVKVGQTIAYMGDSGNAEGTAPHLHFEIHRDGGEAVNPWASLRLSQGLRAHDRCRYNQNPLPGDASTNDQGYWVLGADGGIFSFGGASFHGSVPGLGLPTRVTTVRMAATPTGQGYWILGADGGIFSFGDAEFFGSVPGLGLRGVRGVDFQATPTGRGYWILGADGGIFSFGDAKFFGSVPGVGVKTVGLRLVPTPTGQGYWVLDAAGGIFSFGDAAFFGSVPALGIARPAPAISAAAAPSGDGYWVLDTAGGIHGFGGATHFGSLPGFGLCSWPKGTDIAPTGSGDGYLVLGGDGSIWAFGAALHRGAVNALGLSSYAPVIDLTVTPVAG